MRVIFLFSALLFISITPLVAQVASQQEILNFVQNNHIIIQEEFGSEVDKTVNVFSINFCGENNYRMYVTTTRKMAGYPDQTSEELLEGYWKFHEWQGYNCIHYNKQFQGRTLIHALLKDENGGLRLYNNQGIINMGQATCR